MEASEALTPTTEAPAEPAATGTITEQVPNPNAPILERLDELGQQFGAMQPLLQQMQPQAPTAPAAAEPEALPSIADLADDGYIDPSALEGYIGQAIDRGIQQGIAPALERAQRIEQQLADERLDALADVYPELQDDQKAQNVIAEAATFARKLAEDRGMPELAELVRDPDFVEMMYLAGRARGQATQPQDAGAGEGATLEGGSAASPAAPAEDPALAILKAGRPSGPWGH